MKNNPVVSVIIPVYNVEKYLEECIDSVLAQTYQNIEIILVNDGSTDSSGLICDRYAEKNSCISVIHKENGGQSTARNVGIEHADGKYIYFMDSDDILLSAALEKLYYVADENNADIVFFDAESFVDDGYNMKLKQSYIRNHTYLVQSGMKTFEQMQKNKEFSVSVPLLFFRSDFLKNSNINFCSGIYYEDMIFAFEIFCSAHIVSQCKEILYRRRYRSNSTMTSKKSKKYFDSSVIVYRRVQDFSEKNNLINEKSVKKYICRNAFNVFNNYNKLSSEDKCECKAELNAVKKDILQNKAYGNTALKMKCYSDILWFVYKVFEKITGMFK